MTEPDELYTLRAQYWLGHYALAIEEAKSVLRRPMSPQLKLEREEFLLRAQLALGQYDKVIAGALEGGDRPGTYVNQSNQSIVLYNSGVTNSSRQSKTVT
jgi:Coatomer epsilon subunit